MLLEPARLLTAKQVSELLLVAEQRVHDMGRKNLIPHLKLGRQVRFDPHQLEQWLASGGTPLPGGWRMKASRGSDSR